MSRKISKSVIRNSQSDFKNTFSIAMVITSAKTMHIFYLEMCLPGGEWGYNREKRSKITISKKVLDYKL